MANLVCTEEFLNKLIKESIIEPNGDGKFTLYTKANLKGEHFPINVTCDNNVNIDQVKKYKDNKTKTCEEWYTLVRLEFPTNAGKHLAVEGRNLRSGNKTRIKKNIQKLIDESYNMEAVIDAIKYEVWMRIKSSSPTDNKLEYMKALEAWLNDTTNIDAMIERSQESNEFKIAMNIYSNGNQKSQRKIKLT